MNIDAITEPIVGPSEAARLLALSPESLRQHRHRRTGPPYITLSDRVVVYPLAALIRFFLERKIKP